MLWWWRHTEEINDKHLNKFSKKSMNTRNMSILLSTAALVISLIMLVAWCAVSYQLSPLDIVTYESVIVSVLGILITLLIGWNIYTIVDVKQVRQDMLDCKDQMFRIESSFQSQSEKLTSLADAYAFMGLAEMFLTQGKYVSAYCKFLSSILCFEKAKEHNLALHECNRMYMLIRDVRRHLTQRVNDYVLDYDLYNDVAYEKDIAELCLVNLEPYKVTEIRDIFQHFISLSTKYIVLNDVEFIIFDRNVDLKKRPLAIYLLIQGNKILCKTTDFDKYVGLLTCDLNLNHDSIAISEFSSIEKMERVYALIDAQEIIGHK